ncbi:MAG: 3,4-dihydroxy-2-butanone-4-phosphate synthase, partial [Deltaproteobacteria bacterium]|nr:3,4-dihydroxy-2-butanone-4-phosphate synthase [Deltaproteobacteria bacterium]
MATVDEAMEELKRGRMVIMVDDEARENEGDLVMAAEHVTPEAINFMAKHGRGLVCLAMTEERAEKLHLPLMVSDNTSSFQTGFTISIDAKAGTTTGISASDRAVTIKAVLDDNTRPDDLARPGHIFPLIAKKGGLLVRTGHTEGSVDLVRLSGLRSMAVICEILNEDGSMARLPDLETFACEHDLCIVTIADIVEHRMRFERLVHRDTETHLPIIGDDEFRIISYRNDVDNETHVALVKGDPSGDDPVLVRVHSECLTGDVFGSCRCDCGPQLRRALEMISQAGRGVLLYIRQE